MLVMSIWNRLTAIFGMVVLVGVIINIILIFVEKYNYSRKIKAIETSEAVGSDRGDEAVRALRRIGIITGASSGLGAGYASRIDRDADKYDIDELWLFARNKERLEAAAKTVRRPVRLFTMDLAEELNIDKFEEMLKSFSADAGPFKISLLINCAGYGRYGSSEEIGRKEECRMIDVNDKAAISMTNAVLPYMHAGSRIVEICSVAAFHPIPLFNAYAASKSLLYTYSRALRIELLKKGISVTAVCPYWVKDTAFIETATGEKRKVFLPSKTKSVVRISLWDIRKRHAISTPGIMSTIDRFFAGLIPDEVLGHIMSKFL